MARKSFLLRIDERLHAELRRWADDDLRSINAQIEFLLRNALREQRGRDPLSAKEPPAADPAEE